MENRTHTQTGITGLLLVMWMSHAVLAGTIIYVDPQAPGDNDGSSWADAYICLQNALESAEAGDEIRVAQGTYRPDQRTVTSRIRTDREVIASGLQTESFVLPDAVTVRGGYAGYDRPNPDARNIEAYASILSGDLSDNDVELGVLEWDSLLDFVTHITLIDNAHTVVTAIHVSSQTVLDGFTITAGRGEGGSTYPAGRSRGGTTPIALPQPSDDTEGAGAYVDFGRPVFTNCTFFRNTVTSLAGRSTGGAGVVNDRSDATFQTCTFEENIAFGYGGSSLGAAVLNFNGAPEFVHCTFKNNVTAGFSGDHAGGAVANVWASAALTGCTFIVNKAIDAEGGAIFNYGYSSRTPIVDCTFTDNSADLGGAVSNREGGNPDLVGCIFLANEAMGAGQGGAVYNGNESIHSLLNCHFLGNTAAGQGGAVCAAGPLTIVNCVFSGNSAATGGAIHDGTDNGINVVNSTFTANQASENGGAYYGLSSRGRFTNCILWDDAPQEVYSLTGTMEILYSDVQGYSSMQEGNIDADPRFQDALGTDGIVGTLDDDLTLLMGSPCIDAGSNTALIWNDLCQTVFSRFCLHIFSRGLGAGGFDDASV